MLPALNLSLRPAINNDISNPWRKSAYEMALKENRKLADIARKENEKLTENIDTLKEQLTNNSLELQKLQMQIKSDMGEERAAEKKELEREIAELKKTIKKENNVHDLRKTLDTLNRQLETQVAELNKLREVAVFNPVVTEPSAVKNIQEAMKELKKIVDALSTQCQKRLDSGLRKDSADEVKRTQSTNQTPRRQRPTPILEEEKQRTINNGAVERAKKAKENANRPKSAPPAARLQSIQEEKTTSIEPPGETDRFRPSAEEKAKTPEWTSRQSRKPFPSRRARTQPGNPR